MTKEATTYRGIDAILGACLWRIVKNLWFTGVWRIVRVVDLNDVRLRGSSGHRNHIRPGSGKKMCIRDRLWEWLVIK